MDRMFEEYRNSVIQIYENVLNGNLKSFPKSFFTNEMGVHNAIICIRYLIENILKWEDDRKIKFGLTKEVFQKYKLGSILKKIFTNSTYAAITTSYPKRFDKFGKSCYLFDEIFTDRDLLESIQNKARELNRIPFANEMEYPNERVYLKRFGSWKKAVELANLGNVFFSNLDELKINKEEIFMDLIKSSIKMGRCVNDYEILSKYKKEVIQLQFGSLSKLKEILKNDIPKAELDRALMKLSHKLNRIPNISDLKYPSFYAILKIYKTWEDALYGSGVMSIDFTNSQNEEIITSKRKYRKNKKPLNQVKINKPSFWEDLKSELKRLNTTNRLTYDKCRKRSLPTSLTITNRLNMNWRDVMSAIYIEDNIDKSKLRHLKDLMMERGIKNIDLAKELNIQAADISDWINNRKYINPNVLEELSKKFNVDKNHILPQQKLRYILKTSKNKNKKILKNI